MNKFLFTSVSNNTYSDHCRVHFIFPQQDAPYNRTELIDVGSSLEIKLLKGPFFILVHRYDKNNRRLLGRDFSTIDFQQNSLDFGTYVLHYMLEKPALNYSIDKTFFAKMEQVVNTLNQYVDLDLFRLQEKRPVRDSLKLTHSVFYTLEGFSPALKIPYVSLVGRGKHLLKGIKMKDVNNWQSFFINFMPTCFRECSFSPANFCFVGRKEKLEKSDRYFIYNAIATVFSHIVRQKIQYQTDIQVTPFKDFVGLNIIDGKVYGDCEDQAQMIFDLIRIFKKLFPTKPGNIYQGDTTLCYHVSYWLQRCEIWLIQGAVGDNAANTHVWCGLLPTDGGPIHYIESTGATQPSFYKYLVRAWKMSTENKYLDCILIDPTTGLYGLPSSCVTMVDANAFNIFRSWATPNSTMDITDELEFATLLDAPVIHPMHLLMHFK